MFTKGSVKVYLGVVNFIGGYIIFVDVRYCGRVKCLQREGRGEK